MDIWTGIFLLARNTKNEIKCQEKTKNLFFKKCWKTKRMRQKKRDILWKEIEREGKWQKRNKHKQTNFWEKGEMDTRRERCEKRDERELDEKNQKIERDSVS